MPIETVTFTTTEPELADRFMHQAYRPERPFSHNRSGSTFDYSVVARQAGGLRIAHAHHTLATAAELPPVSGLAVNTVLGGRLWCSTGGAIPVRAAAGDVVMYPQAWRTAMGWDDLETEVVRLPMAAVRAAASEIFGDRPEELTFLDLVPMTAAGARLWRRASRQVQQQLAAPDSLLDGPVALEAAITRLARAAVTAFPHSFGVDHHRSRTGVLGPSVLRRTAWALEAAVEEPVTLTDVAQSVGVEALALDRAFRRAYGLTPLEYLERIRLETAHHELELGGATDDDSVADVAARTSFATVSAFVSAYRRRFGIHPVETLWRARETW